ncbi:hypothetical protein KYB31_15595 [Clostridium felsineum]|uniref:hypothetical protein n=1 Tax=Clostridium felsineum TaxID=36839 RepID=UPI00214D1D3F|nr:hypothetical protein [Clostridium felsineum]MCR3760401.1 hypothetical protein [Clostridium felsineum]
MKVELNENEIKLISEALMNSSLKCAHNASVMKDIDPDWAEDMQSKSDKMGEIVNRLKIDSRKE